VKLDEHEGRIAKPSRVGRVVGPTGKWEPLVPRLRAALPQFLTLGPYDVASRSGPAIWLRCAIAGKIDVLTLPTGTVPIHYLPGVGRATLRATEDCPQELKPLAALQYRGVIWSQANAKDWTVAVFLQTEKGGLHLTTAKEQATAASLRRAVETLADIPVAELKAKSVAGKLNGNYFDSLISDDLVSEEGQAATEGWHVALLPRRGVLAPGQ
jgi:hypothetical protein